MLFLLFVDNCPWCLKLWFVALMWEVLLDGGVCGGLWLLGNKYLLLDHALSQFYLDPLNAALGSNSGLPRPKLGRNEDLECTIQSCVVCVKEYLSLVTSLKNQETPTTMSTYVRLCKIQ